MTKINKIIFWISYTIFVLFVFVIVDVFVLKGIFKIGNQRLSNNLQAVQCKVEYPYAGFISRSIAETEPFSIYYTGEEIYKDTENKIKIAFFGGSTAAFNDNQVPDSKTIPQYLESILKNKLKKDVVVINYACGGAHHRQHLHMLLEFLPKFKPDIVIYYGGNNETIQAMTDDPRFSYPFNYYYKAEMPIWIKMIAEYSAIGGVLYDKIDKYFLEKVRKRIRSGTPKYYKAMEDNYIETIKLSKNVTNTFKSKIFGNAVFVSIFQPLNIIPAKVVDETRRKLKSLDYAYDFYNKYDKFSKDIYYDYCHVKDEANQYMAGEIADLLINKYLKKYKK